MGSYNTYVPSQERDLLHKAHKKRQIMNREQGYRIIPVNPKANEILGAACYPDLSSISEKVVMDR